MDAIILGIKFVQARGDSPLKTAASRAYAKINATLPDQNIVSQRQASLLALPEQGPIGYLSSLRTAVRKRNKVTINYLDLENNDSTRVVRPLGLTAFDRVWLLTAWCEMRNGFRDFRVDRIQSVYPTGNAFAREPGREFSDYLRML